MFVGLNFILLTVIIGVALFFVITIYWNINETKLKSYDVHDKTVKDSENINQIQSSYIKQPIIDDNINEIKQVWSYESSNMSNYIQSNDSNTNKLGEDLFNQYFASLLALKTVGSVYDETNNYIATASNIFQQMNNSLETKTLTINGLSVSNDTSNLFLPNLYLSNLNLSNLSLPLSSSNWTMNNASLSNVNITNTHISNLQLGPINWNNSDINGPLNIVNSNNLVHAFLKDGTAFHKAKLEIDNCVMFKDYMMDNSSASICGPSIVFNNNDSILNMNSDLYTKHISTQSLNLGNSLTLEEQGSNVLVVDLYGNKKVISYI